MLPAFLCFSAERALASHTDAKFNFGFAQLIITFLTDFFEGGGGVICPMPLLMDENR